MTEISREQKIHDLAVAYAAAQMFRILAYKQDNKEDVSDLVDEYKWACAEIDELIDEND